MTKHLHKIGVAFVIPFILLSCLYIIPEDYASAQACGAAWDITGTSGIKANYQLGEAINGSISFRINNPSDCPGCFLQILVGLVDSQNTVIDVKCIYDGQPKVCPGWTVDTVNVSWEHPFSPGNYRLLATLDSMYSCSDAKPRFRPQESYKLLSWLTVSASNAIAPTTPPSFPELSSNNPPVILSFSANPSSIKKGESTRISWEVVDATQIFVTPAPGRSAPKAGYTTAQLSEPTTYTLTATNSYGSVTKEITVNIIGVSPTSSSLNEPPTLPTLPTKRIADTIDGILLIIKTWIQQLIHFILTVLLPVACIVIIGIIVWKNRKLRPNPKNAAYIYIMYNPSLKKDYYKVGRSRNTERRAEELSAPTGVPGKFQVEFKLWVTDAVLAEKRVHTELEKYRPHDNKEFFELPIDTIIDTIRKNKN
jgi:hypothetical protein